MQVSSCSCRGSKTHLAIIFWEALGKSARQTSAFVVPLLMQSFLNALCSESISKI